MAPHPDRREIVSVEIAADADTVWAHVREPVLIRRWFGWHDDDLDDEIRRVFVTDARVMESDELASRGGPVRSLLWKGGDVLTEDEHVVVPVELLGQRPVHGLGERLLGWVGGCCRCRRRMHQQWRDDLGASPEPRLAGDGDSDVAHAFAHLLIHPPLRLVVGDPQQEKDIGGTRRGRQPESHVVGVDQRHRRHRQVQTPGRVDQAHQRRVQRE